MPIYEFQCDRCGHVFERLQKLSDPDPDQCPECAEHAIRKCLTAPAFRLSGSGWYETDFKKDGDKKRNLTGKGDAAGAESRPQASGDAKSESKPESRPAASPDVAAASRAASKADTKAAAPPASKPAAE